MILFNTTHTASKEPKDMSASLRLAKAHGPVSQEVCPHCRLPRQHDADPKHNGFRAVIEALYKVKVLRQETQAAPKSMVPGT